MCMPNTHAPNLVDVMMFRPSCVSGRGDKSLDKYQQQPSITTISNLRPSKLSVQGVKVHFKDVSLAR